MSILSWVIVYLVVSVVSACLIALMQIEPMAGEFFSFAEGREWVIFFAPFVLLLSIGVVIFRIIQFPILEFLSRRKR